MAHYAKLDENNIVLEVNVVDNEIEVQLGEEGVIQWLKEGWGGVDWKKTSFNTSGNQHPNNTPFRKNFAGIGFTYDAIKDAFIEPKPFGSWTLNNDTCLWEAPVPYPNDNKLYFWKESIGDWVSLKDYTP